jgi:hypothetical protein
MPFSHTLLPAYAHVSIGLQQVPANRRGKEEKAGLEAGTINVISVPRISLRPALSVGLLVSTNIIISRGC